jgi:hypothetical protein
MCYRAENFLPEEGHNRSKAERKYTFVAEVFEQGYATVPPRRSGPRAVVTEKIEVKNEPHRFSLDQIYSKREGLPLLRSDIRNNIAI